MRMEREGGAVLVGAGEDRHMAELGRLADTLGLDVSGVLEQARRDGSGYIGKGKREELAALVEETGADFVVTDDELTASQTRVLEKACGVDVVDRTALIIRIFESHARDAASRLEVELAELTYRLPRVKGGGEALSRLGGGGDTTRGPGEQKLEYDRRVIRERIQTLNLRLDEERAARAVRGRRRREGLGPPSVALVGYTNAGKTTILNALSGARRSTKDRLFETLETTTRLVRDGSQGGGEDGSRSRPDFVVTDTVGFIQKLPTQLVHSFASTLEAAREADIVVLCADASSEELAQNVQTVRQTLSGTGKKKPDVEVVETVLCLNKIDLLSGRDLEALRERYPDAILTNASEDVRGLVDAIHHKISRSRSRMVLRIPHSEYGTVGKLYEVAEIHTSQDTEDGVLMDVSMPARLASRYEKFDERSMHSSLPPKDEPSKRPPKQASRNPE